MSELIVELHVPIVATPGLPDTEDEAKVLAAAKRVASAPHVPAGAFLVINDSDGDMGRAGEWNSRR